MRCVKENRGVSLRRGLVYSWGGCWSAWSGEACGGVDDPSYSHLSV